MKSISAAELLLFSLDEDRARHDVTTPFFFRESDRLSVELVAKSPGVFCGAEFVTAIWPVLKTEVAITEVAPDGAEVQPGDILARFTGLARAVLAGERTLLNIIQRLSGVATQTRAYVRALNNSEIHVLDTRKTTPLWRDFEKYAVRIGGGYSHRRDLSDMVLIKENHLAQIKANHTWSVLGETLRRIRANHPNLKIEIEIDSLDLLRALDLTDANIIMLDNFALSDIPVAIDWIRSQELTAEIEISGGVTLQNIGQYAQFPVQRISIGALTHSVPAMDISMLTQTEKPR